MYGSRLLPGEQRRYHKPSVEESHSTSRSVQSIRQRFEQSQAQPSAPASAPSTPAKKTPAKTNRNQTKTQAELAAFLRTGIDRKSDPRPKTPDAASNGKVGSLIERFSPAPSRANADRHPLRERDLQRVDDSHHPLPAVDSVDTFGSSSADIDRAFPKTDPGRLESYANAIRPLSNAVATAANADAVTGDQSLREMVSKGIQKQSEMHVGKMATPPSRYIKNVQKQKTPSPESSSTDPQGSVESPTEIQYISPPQAATEPVPSPPESDWGAGDVYIRELFAEAEDTAERAVHCDENEEYFEAFELYWVVVDLYYKVIPFLTPEEGVDVHERIKMYTRRCEAIREAFEDDPEGQDEIQIRIADATQVSAQKEEQIQENFNANMWASAPDIENIEKAGLTFQSDQRPPVQPHPKSSERKHSDTRPPTQKYELERTKFPDYSNEKPLAAIPEAPRGQPALLSASTKAHRNSLSRPISRSAVRASTSSVSRERVAEMQERVNVMQECLNNFTVKRKHLGPARALELHVTTLNANTFGDLKKLEPLAPELEHKWATELEVLLSMLQEIKEVRPGTGYALRDDIARHLPALERCDRSVRKTMRSFSALIGHVQYVERETAGGSAKGGRGRRRWWVKVPVVSKGGLPEDVGRIVEEAEKEMRGVFKVCHEINVDVVKSMPVPLSFVESLPKHARNLIPRELKEGLTTWGMFKVSDYMKDRNLWHKDAAKEITSSLEKVALIWEAKTSNKSFLSRTFDIRGERFHQAMTAFRRCQNAIRDLRREW